MNQVLYVYWQAWGYEQAQLRKQLYIEKTSNKLDKIIKRMYINAMSKMIFNYPTPELRNEDLKSLIPIPQDINGFMDDLEFLSKMCLQDRLPIFGPREAYPHYNKYMRCRSRIFRPLLDKFPKFPKLRKRTTLDWDTFFRVDAIVCLY
jgi:hypothetical protein